jgi:drug/metabolite transporter (DMT)-like permease
VSRLDLLLLLMIVIWGSNFSIIKSALRDFPEISFNAMRLGLASAVFLGVIAVQARRQAIGPPLTRADWRRIALLGFVGHLLYQLCFLAGVARTSVANSALIFGCTPVMVALLSSLAGHERLRAVQWLGAALSLSGVYAIVGQRAAVSSATVAGDALVFAGMFCWSTYSVVAQPLLRRHSPLVITGYSMTIGALLYVVIGAPALWRTEWAAISIGSWWLMAASSLLALAFAYIVWYTAVQKIGSARTAMYSNFTPIVAMTVGALWLREPVGARQLLGAALILAGVFITRLGASIGASPPAHPQQPPAREQDTVPADRRVDAATAAIPPE